MFRKLALRVLEHFPGRSSSFSDNGDYPNFCNIAAQDAIVFQTFRSHPSYVRILEHVTAEQGKLYLEACNWDLELSRAASALQLMDKVGGPKQYFFEGIGLVSPTTLRYLKVASDLLKFFPNLLQLSIAEIGIGYGGQFRALKTLGHSQEYSLIDLAPVISLANRFLNETETSDSKRIFYTPETITEIHPAIVVSNYAFSELAREVQEQYIDQIIQFSPRGYMVYNHVNPKKYKTMSAVEFASRVPGARILPEDPLTFSKNVLIVWGSQFGLGDIR